MTTRETLIAINKRREGTKKVNVKEMVFRGEDATKMFACGKCGKCYSYLIYACADDEAQRTARAAAEKCCVPPTCSVCGTEVSSPWTMCPKHREQANLRRATPIPAKDWSGPVFSDDVSGDWGDGYSSDIDTMLQCFRDEETWRESDHYAPFSDAIAAAEQTSAVPPDVPMFEPRDTPAYCWPCVSQPLRLEPESLLENAVDGMHEDAHDQIVDADELCEFIESWNAKQTCKSWYPDHSRVIVLDPERFDVLVSEES